jgi:hypothetical protein
MSHFEEDGEIVFREACRLGCEGIVSKPYRSGRSAHWVKVKNPRAPAVTREAEVNGRTGRSKQELLTIRCVRLLNSPSVLRTMNARRFPPPRPVEEPCGLSENPHV